MTSLPKLVFSIILILVLIQSGHAKTSTENLIVEKSDILNLKKSTEIEDNRSAIPGDAAANRINITNSDDIK